MRYFYSSKCRCNWYQCARIRGYEKHIISHISKTRANWEEQMPFLNSATPLYPRNGLTIYAQKNSVGQCYRLSYLLSIGLSNILSIGLLQYTPAYRDTFGLVLAIVMCYPEWRNTPSYWDTLTKSSRCLGKRECTVLMSFHRFFRLLAIFLVD